jgi:hypothetical protein
MLKYAGHVFLDAGICSCCVGDQRKVSVDPTGTKSLRVAFNSSLAIKWRGLRVLVKQAVIGQDLLTLGGRGLMNVANPAIQGGATKTQMFQRWFDYTASAQVLHTDGSFMRAYIEKAYSAGQSFAQKEVGHYVSALANDRIETLFRLAVVELQGVVEAVSQKAVRAVASGLLHGDRPARICAAVLGAVDSVGITRSTAIVELITVKAFSEGTLDTYEAAGVQRVGLLPETILARKTTDARTKKIKPSGSAGSRSRRGEAPGLRTIQRIRSHEKTVESNTGGLVSVETAGDNLVCPVCKSIARKGPYRINKARSLIPAHPRCRCVFVPAVSTARPRAKKRTAT